MGEKSAFRSRVFRGIHAEALKRGMDHDALRDMAKERFQVHAMSELSDTQLLSIYRGWTGKTLKRRTTLPRRGCEPNAGTEMVSAEDLLVLDQEFAKRGLADEPRDNFIRRQLRGRILIRTRRDLARVLTGIRAMNKRDGL